MHEIQGGQLPIAETRCFHKVLPLVSVPMPWFQDEQDDETVVSTVVM